MPALLHAGVPRLFDLVRVKEEHVKLAFYFALRDTVVADTLDQASRIAYGKDRRWGRVVTIKVRHRAAAQYAGGQQPTCCWLSKSSCSRAFHES